MNRVAPAWVFVTLLSIASYPSGCTPLEPGTDRFEAGGSSPGGAAGSNMTGGSGGALGGNTSGGATGGTNGGTTAGSNSSGGGRDETGGDGFGGTDSGGGKGGGEGGGAGCPPLDERDTVRVPDSKGEHEISQNTAWTCDHDYVLNGNVLVAPETTLTIEAGTRVRAATGAMLIALRRARLDVLGTEELPVVFTSDEAEGERSPGDWRGVVLIGDAPTHAANVQVYNTLADHRADFGGGPSGSPTGSCGTIRYARIEFAGGNLDEPATPGAALTFAGCGSGTVVDHVQVHRPTDGVGLMGGTVSLRRVLVTGNSRGDSIEWNGGFTGTLQFVVAQSLGGGAGILGSNAEADPGRLPVSAPKIYNATLVGSAPLVTGSHFGFLLQFGSFTTFKNSIVEGFADAAFDLRVPSEVLANELGPGKSVDVSHILMYGNAASYTTEAMPLSGMTSMRIADPGLDAALEHVAPSFLPTDDDVLIEATPPTEPFDTTATYRGAMPPTGPDWTRNWTAFPAR